VAEIDRVTIASGLCCPESVATEEPNGSVTESEVEMTRLIELSRSLRRGALNAALLKAVAGLLPDGVELTISSIRDIPLKNGDVEAEDGIPEPVTAIKEAITAAIGSARV
jgi:hypothetical protein